MTLGSAPSKLTSVLLEEVYVLIQRGWVQNVEATDKDGNFVDLNDKGAVNFHLLGALLQVAGEPNSKVWTSPFLKCLNCLKRGNKISSILAFHDVKGRTKEEVLRAVRVAIEYAKRYEHEGRTLSNPSPPPGTHKYGRLT